MINSRKKGFTLVELVIVIAVIAILAAVLIPTFSSLVKKANLSADEQAVRQINTLLATEFVTEKPESLKDVVDMLDENGYNVDALIPLSKGYAFVWDKESNTISLVLIEKIEAGAEKLEEGTSYINVEVSTADKLLKALKAGSDITLEKDIIIPDDVVTLKGDVTIDLNGYNLDSSASTSRPFTLSNGSKLTIDAEGSTINCGLYGLINISEGSDATIIINGGTFNANTKDGSFIKIRNNSNVNITLNDVTYIDTASRSVNDIAYVLDASLNKGKSSLTINGGHFESYNGFCLANMEVTISGAKISAKKYGLEAGGNTKVTVENCIVQTTKEGYECAFFASHNGTLIISNSTFNGDCNYAYGVLPTGGTLTASNNKVNTANEYYVYQLQEGASAFVTINGEKK